MARASPMPALDGKKPYRCWRDLRKPCGHGALSTKWKISSCSGGLIPPLQEANFFPTTSPGRIYFNKPLYAAQPSWEMLYRDEESCGIFNPAGVPHIVDLCSVPC